MSLEHHFFFRGLRPLWRGLRDEISGLVDRFLPVTCAFCGSLLTSDHQPSLCPSCLSTMRNQKSASCSRCALHFPDFGGSDHLCGNCLLQPPLFRTVFALGVYEGPLRQAIHRFKYRQDFTLATPLGHLLGEAVLSQSLPHHHLIIPVPLHPRRLRQRTFNQALLLARVMGKQRGLPVAANLLRRVLHTPPQQGLSLDDRRHNLFKAFAMQSNLSGEAVLLVDDVMTSGATVAACTRALLENGAQTVDVAILARAAKSL